MKWDVNIGDDFHFHGSGLEPDSFDGKIIKIFYEHEDAPIIVIKDEFEDCRRLIDLSLCKPCSRNAGEM